MKVIKSVLGGIVDLLMLVVIVIAIGVTLISLTSDNNDISKIGKFIPLNVKTNSMEPTIDKGDFILMEEVDVNNLKVGDVIAFFATEDNQVIVKTHRIVDVVEDNAGRSFITRGDFNKVNDSVPVFPADVIGIWNEVRLAKVGTVLDFISSQYGFLICIVLPLLILFVYQIYRFIVVIMEERNAANEKNEAAILAAAEKIRAKQAKKVE